MILNSLKPLRWLLLPALLGLLLYLALLMRPSINPQSQGIERLESRLHALGIPLKEVKVVKQSPLEVEVTLQSSSQNKNISNEEFWYLILAERELEMAYLKGERVAEYITKMVNQNGESFGGSHVWLYPDTLSQQVTPLEPSPFSEEKLVELFKDRLGQSELRLQSIEISTRNIVRENARFVDLVMLSPDPQLHNQRIDQFISSVIGVFIREFNEQYQAQISLMRLRIVDASERELLFFILDIDRGGAMFWAEGEGIEGDWYPRPAPLETPGSTPTPWPTQEPMPYPISP